MNQTKDFRAYISNWIDKNCPKSMMTPMPASEQVWASSSISFPNSDSEKWFNAMTQTGYSTPEWPKEYGGAGLDFDQAQILRQELKKRGCRNPQINFGITMLGPVLLEFGTEDQKKEFLPKIARGEIWWCQGFSEPGAGSDLAGVSTTANLNDNETYKIN